jgi:hypothetical protein
LLLSERQAAEEARKAHADGEARNSELAKKLEDAAKKMDQLQESVQRFVNASWSGTGWILVLMPYDRIVCMPLMISLSLIKLMQSFRFLVCLLDISLHNFTLVMRYLCLQVGTFLIAYSHPFDFTCVRALHAHMFPPPLPLSRFFFFALYIKGSFILQAGGETFQLRVRESSASSTGTDYVTNREIFVCTTKINDYPGGNGIFICSLS